MRIGVVNNLRAGKSQEQVSRMLGFLRSHPDVLHVETEHAGLMPEALADLAAKEVDLLVVNGGDGTLQYVLTEILGGGVFGDRVPLIAPLRAGRTNMSAMDLGAASDPLRGLAEVIACAENLDKVSEEVWAKSRFGIVHPWVVVINETKSKCLTIRKSEKCPYPEIPQIPIVDTLQILGVTLNSKWNFNNHIDKVLSVVSKRLYAMRILKPSLSHADMILVYNSR